LVSTSDNRFVLCDFPSKWSGTFSFHFQVWQILRKLTWINFSHRQCITHYNNVRVMRTQFIFLLTISSLTLSVAQVGINTQNPAGPFHVYSDGTLTPGGLVLLGDTSSNYMILDFDRVQPIFFNGTFDIPGNLLLLPDGGDLGVNTEDPDAALHVFSEGDITLLGGLAIFGNRTKGHLEIDFDRIQTFFDGNPLTLHLQPNNGNLNIDNTTLYVNGSANRVGVGTTSLPARLTIAGEGSGTNTIAFQVRNSNLTTSLIVNDGGEVGISGIANPNADLHVGGDILASSDITTQSNLNAVNLIVNSEIRHSGDEHTEIRFAPDQIVLAAGGVDMIDIDQDVNRVAVGGFAYFDVDDDKFGIGVSTPSADLHIRQNNCLDCGIRIENPSLEDWRININANGILELWFQGAKVGQFEEDGEYVQISDARLKSNITSLDNVLSGVRKLRPVRYDLEIPGEISRRQVGFVAQEVASIFPDLVSYDRDQDLHMLRYASMNVITIKAIQELEAENKRLEERIEMLDRKLEMLSKTTE
jgi:hypothetical protein